VLTVGAQGEIVVHYLEEPPVVIDEGVSLTPYPAAKCSPHEHIPAFPDDDQQIGNDCDEQWARSSVSDDIFGW
jgi:hypothetical protein